MHESLLRHLQILSEKCRKRVPAMIFIAGTAWLWLACSHSLGTTPADNTGSDLTNAPRRRFKIPKAVVAGFRIPRPDPAKVAIGERLFLETRFSQYYFANSRGDANTNLPSGDGVVATTITTDRPLPGPFAGFAMNCRACHLVNEH